MKSIKVILILVSLIVILSACSVEIKEKQGCEKYDNRVKDDCKWCEDNGGRMFNRGFSGTECVFPPEISK